jgi:hypothetical protein
MPLQSSGAISLSQIQTEFGGSNPISLSEYYNAASGIPASGTISMNQFYGKSNAPAASGLIMRWRGNWSSNSSGYTAWDYGRTPYGIHVSTTDINGRSPGTTFSNYINGANGSVSLRCYDGGNNNYGTGTLYFSTTTFNWNTFVLPGNGGGYQTNSTIWQFIFDRDDGTPDHSWPNGTMYNGYAFYFGSLQSQTRYLEITY